MNRVLFLIVISLSVTALQAQTHEQLERNVARLRVELSLDRELYLPFEIPTVSIKITNPTAVPLIVPRPFRPDTGTLVLAERLENGRWATNEHGFRQPYSASTPTITMAPNETKQLTFRADNETAFEGKRAEFEWPPSFPGRYRVNYVYTWSAEAAFFFRVQRGDSIDHLVDVAVPGPKVPWYRQVFAVRQGSEYSVCVSRDGDDRRQPRYWISKPLDGRGAFRFHRRVATSALPIIALQAELDPLQRIAIRWTDSANTSRLVVVDLDLNVVQ